jgi:hypothetical protein
MSVVNTTTVNWQTQGARLQDELTDWLTDRQFWNGFDLHSK